jgi:hypothetical protein
MEFRDLISSVWRIEYRETLIPPLTTSTKTTDGVTHGRTAEGKSVFKQSAMFGEVAESIHAPKRTIWNKLERQNFFFAGNARYS